MKTFTFCDGQTAFEVQALTLKAACADYFGHYDTQSAPVGHLFDIEVYEGTDIDADMLCSVTGECDGKGGVAYWHLPLNIA